MVFTGLISLIAFLFVGVHINSNTYYIGLLGFTFVRALHFKKYFFIVNFNIFNLDIRKP